MAIYTANQWRIQVNVAGVNTDTVSWDKASGGDIVAENQTHNPGSMAPAITTGGLRKRNPLTVSRAWSDPLIAIFVALDSAAGVADGTITLTPIKSDRKTGASAPIVYTGVLQTVTRPNADSSTSNIEELTLIFTLNESITGGGQ